MREPPVGRLHALGLEIRSFVLMRAEFLVQRNRLPADGTEEILRVHEGNPIGSEREVKAPRGKLNGAFFLDGEADPAVEFMNIRDLIAALPLPIGPLRQVEEG